MTRGEPHMPHIDGKAIKKESKTVAHIIGRVVLWSIVAVVVTVIYYCAFALVFSTDTERRLYSENRLYERTYSQMQQREQLLGDVIQGIQFKDAQIYRDVFSAEAPAFRLEDDIDIIADNDSIQDRDLVNYVARKIETVEAAASSIEDNFSRVMEVLSAHRDSLPPMRLPLDRVTYAQVGASIGQRVNPYYKVPSEHRGIDIVSSLDEPVYATRGGVVSSVVRSRKGDGNVVEITHSGGYKTRYCHLGDIDVRQGQSVSVGRKLGQVGLSGSSYAAHLHYEVLKGGVPMDPVHYFMASVDPYDYFKMMYMSALTGQSLD